MTPLLTQVIKSELSKVHVWFSLFHASVHIEKSSRVDQRGYEATSQLFSRLGCASLVVIGGVIGCGRLGLQERLQSNLFVLFSDG